jgi:fluoride exporter
MLQPLLIVFAGGGIGSLLRYGISQIARQFPQSSFPYATLTANVVSCILMGIALAFFTSRMNDQNMRLFLITGVCGGFSTFSTFSLETLELIRRGQTTFAIVNISVSLILCIGILALLLKKQTA